MKILVVSNLYPPFQLGGYEIGCRNVVAGLQKLGHEVHVLTSPCHVSGAHDEPMVDRNLQLCSFQPIWNDDSALRTVRNLDAMVSNYTNTAILLEKLINFEPDCVYLFNLIGIGGLALLDSLNTLRFPWIFHLMDRVPETLQSGISRPILSIFNAVEGGIYRGGQVISMTNHLVNEIEAMCGFTLGEKVQLIPGWADARPQIVSREYMVNGSAKFVTAGAIQPHKGIGLIVEAAALLQRHGLGNFTIDIYGEGNQAHYIDLCKQLVVSAKIRFLGSRSQIELMEIYRQADAFLFPTWEREPFGFAPVEAASVGCVPIITSTCGAAERLVGNVHCLKISRDSSSLFSVMAKICEGQVNLRDLGYAGQLIARQDLSFEVCLRRIEQILKQQVTQSNNRLIPDRTHVNLAYLKHNLAHKIAFA